MSGGSKAQVVVVGGVSPSPGAKRRGRSAAQAKRKPQGYRRRSRREAAENLDRARGKGPLAHRGCCGIDEKIVERRLAGPRTDVCDPDYGIIGQSKPSLKKPAGGGASLGIVDSGGANLTVHHTGPDTVI
jgi:hypothetical protein